MSHCAQVRVLKMAESMPPDMARVQKVIGLSQELWCTKKTVKRGAEKSSAGAQLHPVAHRVIEGNLHSQRRCVIQTSLQLPGCEIATAASLKAAQ